MPEGVIFTEPQPAPPAITSTEVVYMEIGTDPPHLRITTRDSGGKRTDHYIEAGTDVNANGVDDLIDALRLLNRPHASASLKKRAAQILLAAGKLAAGVASGAPD